MNLIPEAIRFRPGFTCIQTAMMLGHKPKFRWFKLDRIYAEEVTQHDQNEHGKQDEWREVGYGEVQ